MMKQGPASTSVEAVTAPFSSNIRVMPSFRPRRAWIIARFARGYGIWDLGSGASSLAYTAHRHGGLGFESFGSALRHLHPYIPDPRSHIPRYNLISISTPAGT